jgi:iron(III) transport system ATP-binding protein
VTTPRSLSGGADVTGTDTLGVHVDGVSKRFTHRVKGEIYAARNVRIDVAPGEFLTLLGPSGCGKTTTLRMIAGFEKPDAGRIRFGGQDVTDLPANQRNIGFVFQNYALFPHLSVFENVAYGLQVRGQPTAEIARSVADVLQLVGLAGYDHQFSGQLSGGEQQRVALARAIVIRPKVLLFDEPLSNLDAKLRVQMRTEIRDLQQRLAITTVYVTHDQEEAMAVSDRIAVMHQGSVVQEGTAEDLYYRPASEFVATFVGRVNLVPGRIVDIADGIASVAALGTMLRARAARPGLVAGDAVMLVLRPEAIEIARDGGGTLAATVASRTFLGEKVEYVLRCADTTLQAVRYNARPGEIAADGATVSLRVAEDAVTVLPEKA